MTAALEGGEWSAVRPGRTLPPGETRYPFGVEGISVECSRTLRIEGPKVMGMGWNIVR